MLPPLTPVIAGPTAGGKSALAVELALALRDRRGIPVEIITADAFQVYTGLDIGTAKPTIEDRRGIPHHLIDLVPTSSQGGGNVHRACDERGGGAGYGAPFTVNHWLQLATAKIIDLRARNIFPIVVGGTHLYIKALLDGLFDGPEPDPALRDQLAAMNPAARRAELERIDPAAAARIHPNDARRAIRAIEVFRLTGKPITAHQTQWDSGSAPPPHSPYLLTILDWETEPLNRQINARVREMMTRGLLDEVRQLDRAGSFTSQSSEALGYKQLLPIVRDPWPPAPAALDDAVERIKIETRRFAKNQRTWLRRLRTTPSSLVLPCPMASPLEGVEAILRRISVA